MGMDTLDWRHIPQFNIPVITIDQSTIVKNIEHSLSGKIVRIAGSAILGGVVALFLSDGVIFGMESLFTNNAEAVPVMAMSYTMVDSQISGWSTFIKKVLEIIDYIMDGVIIFAGVSWMFGNRTKAIEILIGSGVGYVIVRHHDDIKNFFSLL
ncbi:hypothetical protein D3C71_1562290 [compost metagenome]